MILSLLLWHFPIPSILAQDSSSAFRFVNQAESSGVIVDIRHGGAEKKWIVEANGSGAAALDYDLDGWMDLVIVNGSSLEHLREIQATGQGRFSQERIKLFRNMGGGRFEDRTKTSGLDCPYWGSGVNAADYDGDGDPDILVTTIGRDLLFENLGTGRFREVGAEAGLSRALAWHTGSTFGDYDGDGNLDLYVTGYVDLRTLPLDGSAPICKYRGLDSFCGPMGLAAERDYLYRNTGEGRFTDVTKAANLQLAIPHHGFTPLLEDFNSDGRVDLFVSNDSGANLLFMNQDHVSFKEEGLARGVAFNARGEAQADMGVAAGDFDGDGDLDLLTTTFSEDYFPLFQQESPGFFLEKSGVVGLQVETLPLLGWACGFADLDNDGDKDLWIMNGHVYPTIGERGSSEYLQPVTIFENLAGRFRLVKHADFGVEKNSYRGGLQADFDNDGRIDLLGVPIRGNPILLFNRQQTAYHWIGFRLKGLGTFSDALGARVEIEYCGQRGVDTVRNGGSYLSRNDPGLHFGLGECSSLDQVRVRWPDGQTQVIASISPDKWVNLVQE